MPNQPDQNLPAHQPAVPEPIARLAAVVNEMRTLVTTMDAIVGGLPRAERIEWSRRLVPLRGEVDNLTDHLERKASER